MESLFLSMIILNVWKLLIKIELFKQISQEQQFLILFVVKEQKNNLELFKDTDA